MAGNVQHMPWVPAGLSDSQYFSSRTAAPDPEGETLTEYCVYPSHRRPSFEGDLICELTGGGHVSTWFRPSLDQLVRLLALQENWDSYGAHRIGSAIVSAAAKLLSAIVDADVPPPSVVPTNTGGVQLEWHARGTTLEIEFSSPDRVTVLFEDGSTGEEWQGELHPDSGRLKGFFDKFLPPA